MALTLTLVASIWRLYWRREPMTVASMQKDEGNMGKGGLGSVWILVPTRARSSHLHRGTKTRRVPWAAQ